MESRTTISPRILIDRNYYVDLILVHRSSSETSHPLPLNPPPPPSPIHLLQNSSTNLFLYKMFIVFMLQFWQAVPSLARILRTFIANITSAAIDTTSNSPSTATAIIHGNKEFPSHPFTTGIESGPKIFKKNSERRKALSSFSLLTDVLYYY